MSKKPIPLREALREAIENYVEAQYTNTHTADHLVCNIEEMRIAAFLDQIPLVFEAREPEDELLDEWKRLRDETDGR